MLSDQSLTSTVAETTVESTRAERAITYADLEQLAAKEAVHPISVLRAYAGFTIRGSAGPRAGRAARALKELQRERATEKDGAERASHQALAKLVTTDARAALALALTDGIGFPARPVEFVAALLGETEAETLKIIARAREQLADLETTA